MLAAPLAAVDWLSIVLGAVVGAVMAVIATSLFQERVDRAVFRLRATVGRGSTKLPDLSGIWLSRYRYESAEHPEPKISEHCVVLTQGANHVEGRSLPKPEGSTLTLHLKLEGATLTGEWREWTSKDRLYRGAIQFRLDETRDGMQGAWVGFTRGRGFRTGPWTLERITRETGREARREFSGRADLA